MDTRYIRNVLATRTGVLEIHCQSFYSRENKMVACQINSTLKTHSRQFSLARNITTKNGVLTPSIKQLTGAALEGEIDSHIARDVAKDVLDLYLSESEEVNFWLSVLTDLQQLLRRSRYR